MEFAHQVSVNGEWSKQSCGGMATSATWKINPQFDLFVEKETDVVIVLTQTLAENDDNIVPIGFYVAKRHSGNQRGRILKFGRRQFVATSQFVAQHSVSVELKLSVSPLSYVIVPATPIKAYTGKFELTVQSVEHPVKISPLDVTHDWKYSNVRGIWNQQSSGGCRHHSSWRKNPQFAIYVNGRTSITLSLEVHANTSSPHTLPDCGFYVTKSCFHNRKAIALLDVDMIFKSRFSSSAEVTEEFVLESRAMPYIVVVATRDPKAEYEFTLSTFSDNEVRLEPIQDSNSWNEVSVSADWADGDNGSPPRFVVHLQESEKATTVLPLLVQKQTCDVLEAISVSVLGPDESTLTSSKTSASWEVSTEAASLNPADGPFIIEPAIVDPTAGSSFSLTVFSDRAVSIARENK